MEMALPVQTKSQPCCLYPLDAPTHIPQWSNINCKGDELVASPQEENCKMQRTRRQRSERESTPAVRELYQEIAGTNKHSSYLFILVLGICHSTNCRAFHTYVRDIVSEGTATII